MKRYSTIILFALIAVGLIFVGVTTAQKGHKGAKAKKGEVRYPERFRYWTHVKSSVIQPGHEMHERFGGIHHIYANRSAVRAMIDGREFPNGAVLVFDLYEAQRENNTIAEGPHKFVAVMNKHDKKYATTGGWGFEAFQGASREPTVDNPVTACFQCHESQRARDYVFSKFRK